MFRATLAVIPKNWEPPGSYKRRRNKLWFIPTMEYDLEINTNQRLITRLWTDLKSIMLSGFKKKKKKGQTQKVTYGIISVTLLNYQNNRDGRQKSHKPAGWLWVNSSLITKG